MTNVAVAIEQINEVAIDSEAAKVIAVKERMRGRLQSLRKDIMELEAFGSCGSEHFSIKDLITMVDELDGATGDRALEFDHGPLEGQLV